MAATIKDIASRTGLGLATISKYLNGGNVREKNRILIEQAIHDLDFKVNEFARSLKTSKSKTIGIIIPELSNGFITSIITVLSDILRQKGYATIVCDSRTDDALQKETVNFLLGKMVDGFVIMPTGTESESLDKIIQGKIPIVLIDRMLDGMEEHASAVLINNYQIAYDSTRFFLQQGHKRIGLIAGPEKVYTSQQRLKGYRDALIHSGLPYHEEYVYHGGYTMEGGYLAAKQLLGKKQELTAVFVTNYEMTVGTILAFNEMGIGIPEQLSMIGFDNLDLAKVVRPRLTIVEQPIQEMGRQAAHQLLALLEHQGKKQTVYLDATLKMGESVKDISY